MFFGQDLTQVAFITMVAVAVGGVAMALLMPLLGDASSARRVKAIAEGRKTIATKQSSSPRLMDGQKDSRRKQIQETLKQIELRGKAERRKRMTLRTLITQSG